MFMYDSHTAFVLFRKIPVPLVVLPSAPVLPALLALADERACSGADFVLAYVAGFEVETKIALAVNFHHYQKGWHPTATLGVFGAAAACARLMNLDAEKTACALALAASCALTFAAGARIALDPTLSPYRDAAVDEVVASVDRQLATLAPSVIPARSRASGVIEAWVIEAGWATRLSTPPSDSAREKTRTLSRNDRALSFDPRSSVIMPPKPLICRLASS